MAEYQKDENGRTIYPLKKPVKHGSQEITELRFREPVAGDFRAFPLANQSGGDILDIAARLCGQPPTVIDQLGIGDVKGVYELALSFIPADLLDGIAQ